MASRMKACRSPSCTEKFKPMSPMQIVCSPRCAVDYNRHKASQKQAKQWAMEKNGFYENDVRHQLKLTQQAFNRMRVKEELLWFHERSLEPTCISCGKTHMDWCCGHLKTVGSQSNLRFARENTYLQCNTYCNKHLSGNINGNKNTHGYLAGLKLRFGDDAGQSIIDYCESNTTPTKWSGPELKEMRKEFARLDRELAKKIAEYRTG